MIYHQVPPSKMLTTAGQVCRDLDANRPRSVAPKQPGFKPGIFRISWSIQYKKYIDRLKKYKHFLNNIMHYYYYMLHITYIHTY